jgi:heparan-alpha-glucosaminide N-acetyltransferase
MAKGSSKAQAYSSRFFRECARIARNRRAISGKRREIEMSNVPGVGVCNGNVVGAQVAGERIASVDALRGLTILLMVFVNDLGRAAPSWLHHIQPPDADGMTLADVVFPTFLFLVGMSIPPAFERARAAGTSWLSQLGHILVRTAGLLLMGVIELNVEEGSGLVGPAWGILAFAALILAWCAVPQSRGKKRKLIMAAKAIGIAGLVIMLAIYRQEPAPAAIPFWGTVEGWTWLRIGWWGILGLIGWAYLTVGLLTLLFGRRREWLMGALALLIALHLALNHGNLFDRLNDKPWLGAAVEPLATLARWINYVEQWVSLSDATGSLAAVAMAGCLLGTILRRDSDVTTHRQRLRWAWTFAAGLFLAGCVTDTFEGINKIAATPTWCLWSASLACIAWSVLYLLIDVAGASRWSALVRAPGANPLVAYFLHPILLGLVSLSGRGSSVLAYKDAANQWTVVGGSFIMAAVVCCGAGLLGRFGLRMRL